nr:hypothetical protein [Ramlibacter montanisoli]
MLALQGLLAGHRLHAAVGERGGHHGEVPHVHVHHALPRVQLQRAVDVVADHPEVPQQVRDRQVAVAALQAGKVGRLVQARGAPEVHAEHLHDLLRGALGIRVVQQRGHGDRPGVDHRVVRQVVLLQLDDRVEGFAGRLHVDLAVHRFAAEAVQRQPVDEGLGQGLQREQVRVVAGGDQLAVDAGHRDGKGGRIGGTRFRRVRRGLAARHAAEAVEQSLQEGAGIGAVALHG